MEYAITYQMFQESLKEGKFIGLRCNKCGTVIFPPQAICRECKGTELEKTSVQDTGHIRTFTVIRVPPEGLKPNYVVAMVELDDGAWVIGRLTGIEPEEAGFDIIGRKVKMEALRIPLPGSSDEESYILGFRLI
jgi:hypothetical protein